MNNTAQVFGILFLVSIPALIGWFLQLRSMGNQDQWGEPHNPDLNAQIIDIKTEKVKYTKNNAQLKTTVFFSDGYRYITHLTDRQNGILTYTISLSEESRKAIINEAITSHAAAVQRYQKHRSKHATKLQSGEMWQCAGCGRFNKGTKQKCFCGYSKEWTLQQQSHKQ